MGVGRNQDTWYKIHDTWSLMPIRWDPWSFRHDRLSFRHVGGSCPTFSWTCPTCSMNNAESDSCIMYHVSFAKHQHTWSSMHHPNGSKDTWYEIHESWYMIHDTWYMLDTWYIVWSKDDCAQTWVVAWVKNYPTLNTHSTTKVCLSVTHTLNSHTDPGLSVWACVMATHRRSLHQHHLHVLSDVPHPNRSIFLWAATTQAQSKRESTQESHDTRGGAAENLVSRIMYHVSRIMYLYFHLTYIATCTLVHHPNGSKDTWYVIQDSDFVLIRKMLDMIHQHVGKITDHVGKIMGPTV
jgi:hypothetical protein